MIHRLLDLAIRQRVLVLVVAAIVLAWGAWSFFQLPVEAYPDIMNTQIQIITQWPGHAAEETEKQISVPLEIALNGVPRVLSMRTRTLFGLSEVRLTFEDGVDDITARSATLERLSQATLPAGVSPAMQPMASATGEIFRYFVVGAPVMDLKTIEAWTLEREFKSVRGVADVNSFGGTTKQYQALVDPAKLKAFDLTLANVETALTNGNANGGGNYIERGSEEYIIRAIGLVNSLDDIGNIVVAERSGSPVRVRDVATVRVGYETRLGKVGWRKGDFEPQYRARLRNSDLPVGAPPSGSSELQVGAPPSGSSELQLPKENDDAVMGIVLLRRGAAPDPTLAGIRQKVAELNNGRLPAGVKIIPFVDRTELVNTTTHTVKHNLLMGVGLVVLILYLFLGNVRAAVIVAMTIPFGLLFAFSWMNVIHVPANLISLGAIDFGVIVNGSLIFVENIYRRLARRLPDQSRLATILSAAGDVETEVFFTTLIIILAYLPLFTMESVEGKMFAPMGYTISLALLGSLLMAMIIAPVLCYLALKGNLVDREPRIYQRVREAYGRALGWAIDNPLPVLLGGAGIVALGLGVIMPRLGTEFLPHLDEGNLWIRATLPTTVSYTESARLVPKLRAIISHYQPVKFIESQIGRPDDGTDVTGFYNQEFFVDLKPASEWKGYRTKEELIAAMNQELSQIPGLAFNFSQNIEDNVEEAVTGVKGELAVKLFGDDLDTLTKKAAAIQAQLATVPGVVDLTTFFETGEPQVIVKIDRAKASRYGLNVSDLQDTVQTAVGGQAQTQVLEGERRFDLVARLPHDVRHSVEEIRNITVTTPDDQRIPLSEVADVHTQRGAAFIYRESGRRFIAIKFGVRGRDLGGAIADAQQKVAQNVPLPTGYFTIWGGEFESMQRANARLSFTFPVTLLLIFFVLFAMFNKVSLSIINLMQVPLSLSGAVFALYVTHFHLSVSAAVGFVALFGVAIQNGVVMVSFFEHLRDHGVPFREAIIEGGQMRLRPVLMTAMLASFGLIPAALSTGIGSDIQKPLAVALIGGLLADMFTGTLFVLPVLYKIMCRPQRQTQLAHEASAGEPA
jgi:heavy metal efflux system protein